MKTVLVMLMILFAGAATAKNWTPPDYRYPIVLEGSYSGGGSNTAGVTCYVFPGMWKYLCPDNTSLYYIYDKDGDYETYPAGSF